MAGTEASSAAPPIALILAGAAAIGVCMGGILGLAQAIVLRGHVPHPWRWLGGSMLAWTPAMVVIFTGASAAGSAESGSTSQSARRRTATT